MALNINGTQLTTYSDITFHDTSNDKYTAVRAIYGCNTQEHTCELIWSYWPTNIRQDFTGDAVPIASWTCTPYPGDVHSYVAQLYVGSRCRCMGCFYLYPWCQDDMMGRIETYTPYITWDTSCTQWVVPGEYNARVSDDCGDLSSGDYCVRNITFKFSAETAMNNIPNDELGCYRYWRQLILCQACINCNGCAGIQIAMDYPDRYYWGFFNTLDHPIPTAWVEFDVCDKSGGSWQHINSRARWGTQFEFCRSEALWTTYDLLDYAHGYTLSIYCGIRYAILPSVRYNVNMTFTDFYTGSSWVCKNYVASIAPSWILSNPQEINSYGITSLDFTLQQ